MCLSDWWREECDKVGRGKEKSDEHTIGGGDEEWEDVWDLDAVEDDGADIDLEELCGGKDMDN